MAKKPVKKVLFTSHTANFHKFNRPFMRMLKEQGYVVHYASAGEEKVYDTDKHFDVPFERSPFRLGNIKAYLKLKKIIDREKYDLIHTHTPMGSVVTRLAARAARKKGTRVIYTAHGFHFFKGAPLLNWIVYYPIEKFMARHTDTLVTINNEDYERAKLKFNTDVEYVPGVGVDVLRFAPVDSSSKKQLKVKLGFKIEDYLLIYAAELNKNKNQEFLIRQMPRLMGKIPNLKLVLCGEGNLLSYYRALTSDMGLERNVLFLGYRNDLNLIFQSADLCVASSIREGLGLNLIEAISSGLNVVASDNRGHRDVAINNQGVQLFSLDNSEEYARAVYNSYSRPAGSSKSREAIPHKYSINQITASMSRIYRSGA